MTQPPNRTRRPKPDPEKPDPETPDPETYDPDKGKASDGFPVPNFDPPALRARHDGWTAARQIGFIRALAETGCVAEACRTVGMSESSAYSLRARTSAVSFRNAWETAIDFAMRRLTDVVVSRAINGVAVPIFYQGEQIGERRWYDNRLATFLLRYHDPLRYGAHNDRVETMNGHPEHGALKLAKAISRTDQDAELTLADIGARVKLRLRQIMKEELGEDDDPWPEDRSEEDEEREIQAWMREREKKAGGGGS